MERNKSRMTNESGPGAVLRQGRQDRNLSVEEVGRSLNLALRHIDALENDDYEKLPGPTYVRGYLRGYALLLGLAPQPLLDAFNRLPVAAQRHEMIAPAPVREVTSSDTLVKAGTVLVIGLVVGLGALWWGGKDSTSTRRRPPAASPVAAAPALPPIDLAMEAGGTPTEIAAKAADMETLVPAPVPKTPEPVVGAPAQPEKRVAAVDKSVVPSPMINADTPRVQLVLRVHEDTWADVRDAEDRRLVYQTVSGGRVLSVEGVAPLNVFLGNVDGVRVEFNGQPYDAQRHKRGQIARFILGGAGNR